MKAAPISFLATVLLAALVMCAPSEAENRDRRSRALEKRSPNPLGPNYNKHRSHSPRRPRNGCGAPVLVSFLSDAGTTQVLNGNVQMQYGLPANTQVDQFSDYQVLSGDLTEPGNTLVYALTDLNFDPLARSGNFSFPQTFFSPGAADIQLNIRGQIYGTSKTCVIAVGYLFDPPCAAVVPGQVLVLDPFDQGYTVNPTDTLSGLGLTVVLYNGDGVQITSEPFSQFVATDESTVDEIFNDENPLPWTIRVVDPNDPLCANFIGSIDARCPDTTVDYPIDLEYSADGVVSSDLLVALGSIVIGPFNLTGDRTIGVTTNGTVTVDVATRLLIQYQDNINKVDVAVYNTTLTRCPSALTTISLNCTELIAEPIPVVYDSTNTTILFNNVSSFGSGDQYVFADMNEPDTYSSGLYNRDVTPFSNGYAVILNSQQASDMVAMLSAGDTVAGFIFKSGNSCPSLFYTVTSQIS